uniref:Arrestin-like N-terminal domain-containing protein n=1 Tax=Sinocyclocheilus grahami TaxID=75366 RepID=A0A672LJS7_SINGR
MVAMTKGVKVFEIAFSDPSKTFYCSGDKVSGKVLVEVSEVTRVTAVRVLGVGFVCWLINTSVISQQATGVFLQGQVWARSILREGSDGKTRSARPGV